MASTSVVDMSLEEIIKKKKRESVRTKMNSKLNKPKQGIQKQKPPIADARNKIISKKRTQITDAREKLIQLAKHKDARLKLEQLRKKKQPIAHMAPARSAPARHHIPVPAKFMRTISNKERLFTDPSRQVFSQPLSRNQRLGKRQLHAGRFIDNKQTDSRPRNRDFAPMKPILRTVENDLDIIDDPMGDEYIPPKVISHNRKANLQLRIIAHNNDVRDSRHSAARRLATPDKEKSPPRPPSILKKRPMAALRSENKNDKSEKPTLEYRIIVSNLRNTVTGGDIEELFGDVGGMMESRLVRPGTAEVIYKSVEDAQKAVDLYHNRQLDGQPMNCLLVTPRATATPARSATKPALYSTNSNVEPDISTFHKVLFSNF